MRANAANAGRVLKESGKQLLSSTFVTTATPVMQFYMREGKKVW